MAVSKDLFQEKLLAAFREEAQEHLLAIGSSLLAFEETESPEEQKNLTMSVFQAAHSLKGASRAVNLGEMEAHCQTLESMFAAWKEEGSAPSRGMLDDAHRALNAMHALLRPGDSPGEDKGTVAFPGRDRAGETVRIPAAKLDARLLEAEEMLTAKLTTGQRVADLREISSMFQAWRAEWHGRERDVETLRRMISAGRSEGSTTSSGALSSLLDFFDWSSAHLAAMEKGATGLARNLQHDHLSVGRMVDELLANSKKLLMLPFSSITASFPKIVRDICADQNKEAAFTLQGEEIEIDKRILEEIKDPLIHILRNAVDHGVELPDERRRNGKPPGAAVLVRVSQGVAGKVELVITDDGAGVDTDKVKRAAVERGLLTREQADSTDDSAAADLIFTPDITASPSVTALSGRGLGLAIVREKCERLGGSVSVMSRRHEGTTIRIILPTTLATFRGIIVEEAGRVFVLPTTYVDQVARFQMEDLRTVEGRETITLNNRPVALVRLADALNILHKGRSGHASARFPVVVMSLGEERIAFEVDAVLDEHEVLVKPLAKPLVRVRNVMGATILGSGKVAPILDGMDLIRSAAGPAVQARIRQPAALTKAVETKTILVVENSITSRMLLKSILDAAGYTVKTAVDGADGLAVLRAEHFDLVVSDVEMPRMDGFDLTAKIRADERFAMIPVILITALETPEHRERGMDVGANAYLVKSSFDQSNLLETVRRFI